MKRTTTLRVYLVSNEEVLPLAFALFRSSVEAPGRHPRADGFPQSLAALGHRGVPLQLPTDRDQLPRLLRAPLPCRTCHHHPHRPEPHALILVSSAAVHLFLCQRRRLCSESAASGFQFDLWGELLQSVLIFDCLTFRGDLSFLVYGVTV